MPQTLKHLILKYNFYICRKALLCTSEASQNNVIPFSKCNHPPYFSGKLYLQLLSFVQLIK